MNNDKLLANAVIKLIAEEYAAAPHFGDKYEVKCFTANRAAAIELHTKMLNHARASHAANKERASHLILDAIMHADIPTRPNKDGMYSVAIPLFVD